MSKTIPYDEHIRKAISEIDFRLNTTNRISAEERMESIRFKNKLLEKLKEMW